MRAAPIRVPHLKVPQMILAELRRLVSTKLSALALFALIIVPILYGGLYLWANQDPYAKLPDIPVALVVADEGVPADGDTPARNIGDEVADELIKGRDFDWHRVSAAQAKEGLERDEFDFAITLPADFTAAIESVSGDDPRQADILLETYDANSYLASSIATQAVDRVRTSVAEQVGREAATTLLNSISTIRGKIVEAGQGADELVTGAAELADGTVRLVEGAASAVEGTVQLQNGAAALADGAARVAAGDDELAAAANRVGAVVNQLTADLPQARADIATDLLALGLDQATVDAVLTRLDVVGATIRAGDQRVQEVVGQIDQLASGSTEVANGAVTLRDGLGTLGSGLQELSTGTGTLRDGAATLSSGTVELRDALVSGAQEIPDSSEDVRSAQARTIADPIAIDTTAAAEAANYGAGLAPFFGALAGWIGIYALFLIVRPISRRAVTALHSPVRITLAGWLTPGLLGVLQMCLLFLVLVYALGFPMVYPLGTLGIMLLATLTYTAIILALNVWWGEVGQFIGLVLMVLQLVSAGGTFPWQTLPGPLAALHQVLPMSFVVDGMRQFMYGGDLGRTVLDAAVLLTWLLAAFAIAAIGVTRQTHFRALRDLEPSILG
ncbi:YhgE/Pip family protein [Microbacterium sp. zg.Y625]|uniref:YhgE/Pip family protein n=1 Tax=Microbacterium jiangjiandongii TaxID=3049071 RepID=UPI00214ADD11|nr:MULTISPECIES: YhgE/Pip family protein [unclassified Microbacterium]MCR2794057.1 YhgE/Pip family protein [Microbacterium sp. zg.Y625]MCR2816701.1 YhgE/Pip family protein [Microbacterium sp. zg.Y843]WIM25735.1 YhgE/Pip family protein [Microbacterium sp. zg-Y625]